MTSSRVADPLATIPIMMNRYLLGRWPVWRYISVTPITVVDAACAASGAKPSSHQRSQELEYLLSPRFCELLTKSQARLVSYWEVG